VAAESQKLEPLLPRDIRLFILSGPVAADGYEWYEIVTVDFPPGRSQPMVGWVAVGSRALEPWVEPLPFPGACSEMSPNADSWAEFGGVMAMHCNVQGTIEIHAFVDVLCDDGGSSIAGTPAWLAGTFGGASLSDNGPLSAPGLPVRFHPDLVWPGEHLCQSGAGAFYVVEGHFDDPASATCSFQDADATPSEVDPRIARFWCRTRFVITKLTALN
jgi:hypothetical protein